jgi:hypothetical protein
MTSFCLTCSRVALDSWKNWPHRTPIPFLPEVLGPQCSGCNGYNLVSSDQVRWVNVHEEGNTGLPNYWELAVHRDEAYLRWGRPYLALVECRCGSDAVLSEFGHAVPEYAVNCPMCGVVDKRVVSNSELQQRARNWPWSKIVLISLQSVPRDGGRSGSLSNTMTGAVSALEACSPNRMNVERLAHRILETELDTNIDRDEPNGFCMGFHRYKSGAPASLAAWASHLCLEDTEMPEPRHRGGDLRTASDWLGLDHDWCIANLFYPDVVEDLSSIEPRWAARALQRIRAMGKDYGRETDRHLWSELRRMRSTDCRDV